MAKKVSLQEAGKEAINIMKQAVHAGETFGTVTLSKAEYAVKTMAEANGYTLEEVEAAAQKLSTKKGA